MNIRSNNLDGPQFGLNGRQVFGSDVLRGRSFHNGLYFGLGVKALEIVVLQ